MQGLLRPTRRRSEMLGERVLSVFLASGADIIAEDLGTVPDFVRESLDAARRARLQGASLGAPLDEAGPTVQGPGTSTRPTSVATSGTHDTEPMAVWWEQASSEERAAVLEIPSVRERLSADERPAVLEGAELSNRLREALLESLYRVRSRSADPADPGRVRLARSDQPAGHRRRRATGPGACRGRPIACQPSRRPSR